MGSFIIKEGQVELIENNNEYTNQTSGNRIKVRLSEDRQTSIESLPWCFPLLPKAFQSIPKVGECVLVIASETDNIYSNRFYIGPVISQPQYNEYCPYNYGRGPALSLLQGGNDGHILEKISKYDETRGAFPKSEDVAIIGRTSEDIILKDGEIDIRSGVRGEPFGDDENLKGKVIFNSLNPSYIQLKFKNALTKKEGQEASSIINLVADKINLISHKDINAFNLTDKEQMIKEEELDEIMSKLHELPYGDLLVKYLKIMQDAFLTHGHNFGPATPPINANSTLLLRNIDFDKILSPNVRIS